jgi:large subunit ribosomal protein L6
MSRIGKLPVKIPDKVKVSVDGLIVKFDGPKGKMQLRMAPSLKVEVKGGEVRVIRPDDSPGAKALHGLSRTLVANAVHGVLNGYERVLEISGVGYRAEVAGKKLNLALGFSHPVTYDLPEGITCEVEKQVRVTLRGADKHLLGMTAAQVRLIRPPEPYKGKGIKYAEERIRRKVGKQGAAA